LGDLLRGVVKERAVVGGEGDRDRDRQVADLAGGRDGLFDLREVGLRLDQHEVDARPSEGGDLLGECVERLRRAHAPVRREPNAERPHRARNQHASGAGDVHPARAELARPVRHAAAAEREPGRAEGVGEDHGGPGLDEGAVHARHDGRISGFGSRRQRVLIADDEVELREALVTMLEVHGFQVVGVAATGLEAVALFDATWPDLMLVDYRMPGQDGVAVTRYVKERSPNTQVVLFTVYDEMSLSLDATEAGVFAFLVKCLSPSLILQALSGAWDEKQRRDQEDSQVAHPPAGTG